MRVLVPAFATPVVRPRICRAAFGHRSSLQAQQSMNVAGASRRSAAPGSQFVGVAGYGDVSSRRVGLLPCEDSSPLRPLRTEGFMPPASCLPPVHPSQNCATHSVSLSAHHLGRLRYAARTRRWKSQRIEASRMQNRSFAEAKQCTALRGRNLTLPSSRRPSGAAHVKR